MVSSMGIPSDIRFTKCLAYRLIYRNQVLFFHDYSLHVKIFVYDISVVGQEYQPLRRFVQPADRKKFFPCN